LPDFLNLNDFSLLPCEIHCRLKGLALRFLRRANPSRRGSGQRPLPAISGLNTIAIDPVLPAGLLRASPAFASRGTPQLQAEKIGEIR